MRSLLALLTLVLPLVAAPVPKALKKNPHPLAGEWVVEERYYNELRMQLTDEIRWTIDGDNLTVRGKRQAVPDGFAVNATRTITKPEGGEAGAFDYTIVYTDGAPTSLRPAVIQVDGDRFTLCMSSSHNGPRPTECKPAQGTMMYVLKRVDAK